MIKPVVARRLGKAKRLRVRPPQIDTAGMTAPEEVQHFIEQAGSLAEALRQVGPFVPIMQALPATDALAAFGKDREERRAPPPPEAPPEPRDLPWYEELCGRPAHIPFEPPDDGRNIYIVDDGKEYDPFAWMDEDDDD